MTRLKLRLCVPNGGTEPEKSTMADGFVQVLERLELEYDLTPDIWAAAEDVLQALKTRETNWAPRATETFVPAPCGKRAGQ